MPDTTVFVKTEADHYGLPVLLINGQRYAVAADAGDATRAARKAIEENIWVCPAQWILPHLCAAARVSFDPDEDTDLINSYDDMIKKVAEGANPLLKKLLGSRHLRDLQDQIRDTCSEGGLGEILALGDSEELYFLEVFKEVRATEEGDEEKQDLIDRFMEAAFPGEHPDALRYYWLRFYKL